MMLFLRSLVFTVTLSGALLVIAPLTLLTFPFPFAWRYRFATQWATFALWLLRVVCRLDYTVSGRENIPEQNGIIFCKHQSAWETLALQRIFPPQVWVLKRELMWIPLFGWAMALMEPIPIDRKAGRRAIQTIIEKGNQRLADGRWVVIFPEGTRVAVGARKRYGIGGALLAERTGYPVIPVAHNAGEFWSRRSFIKTPGTIRVVIGPAMETRGKTAAEINASAEDWIESTVERISSTNKGSKRA